MPQKKIGNKNRSGGKSDRTRKLHRNGENRRTGDHISRHPWIEQRREEDIDSEWGGGSEEGRGGGGFLK